MRHTHRLSVVAGLLLASFLFVACGDSEGTPRVVLDGGGEVNITPASPTSETSPSGDGTATPASSEPTSTPAATETPAATPTAAAPQQTPEPTEGVAPALDLSGSPHSTSTVRAAVEAAGGTFEPVDLGATCPNTSVPELTFRSSSGGGAAPTFAVWVYPDGQARAADWATSSGRVVAQTSNCELPNGLVYWNANAVIAVLDPAGVGNPRSHPGIEGFLDMAR